MLSEVMRRSAYDPPATMLERSDEEERRMIPPATMLSEVMRRSGA